MNNKKPSNEEEYGIWLRDKHGVELTDRTKRYYETVTDKIRDSFEKSNYWKELINNLKDYDSEYELKHHYHLLAMSEEPKLLTKPFKSFISKTYRKNILNNTNWPEKPEGGWILPDCWYSKINDLVRTTLVVKYLDGAEFLISKMQNLCEFHDLDLECHSEARQAGYYAKHLYVKNTFHVPAEDWDTKEIEASIEFQLTTQIQEVIRVLLHRYYKKARELPLEENLEWQWNYKSDEFLANYLGHILHYVEGMIMEVRTRQEEK